MNLKNKRVELVFGIIVVVLVGGLMYRLNSLTPFSSDDFNYHYSFLDGNKIGSLLDVIESQKAHYQVMNGRIPAHFLMQLFTIFGKSIFNVANTLVYMSFLMIIMYLIRGTWKVTPFSFVLLFIGSWYYLPSFGSTVLWMDGSFNYLWTTTIVLLAMLPFKNMNIYNHHVNKVIFPIISLIAGWCNETTSAGFIFFQICFIAYLLYTKKKHVIVYIVSIVMSLIGYALMTFSPGQLHRLDSVSGGKISLLTNINDFIVVMGDRYYVEVIIFILLLTISVLLKRDKEINYLATLFFVTAVAASTTIILAGVKTTPDRAYFGIHVFIIIAIGMLIKNIFMEQEIIFKKMGIAYMVVLVPIFLISYRATYVDVTRTFNEFNQREKEIKRMVANGEKELHLKAISSTNNHSSFYMTPDISPNVNHWQNITKSKYYGVDKIFLKTN